MKQGSNTNTCYKRRERLLHVRPFRDQEGLRQERLDQHERGVQEAQHTTHMHTDRNARKHTKKRHRTLGVNNDCARSCTITSQLPVGVAVKQLSRWLAIGCSIDDELRLRCYEAIVVLL